MQASPLTPPPSVNKMKGKRGERSERVGYAEPLWDAACMRIPSMLIDNEYLKEVGVRCDYKQPYNL